MSNDLAIATVTATLKRRIEDVVTGKIGGASISVTLGQPDQKEATQADQGKVNIFLYQATPNPGWRNADLPTRRADGSFSQRPQLALDLHYLLSFYGDKNTLVPERLMGVTLKALHVQPFLTRQMIQNTLADATYSYLAESTLGAQPDLVKFSPVSLSLEELSKIWSVFFQTQYVLSAAYQGSVVLIEPDEEPLVSKPVSDRTIAVSTTVPKPYLPSPKITGLQPEPGEGENAAITALVIAGQNLLGEIASIQINNQVMPLDGAEVEATQITLPLPTGADALPPGVKTLQIRYQDGRHSNLARFAVPDAQEVTP